MGDYNTPWELQNDIEAGAYLVGKGILDASDEKAIAAIATAIRALPKDALTGGIEREQNLLGMRHPAWVELRETAAKLVAQLQPAADRTAEYFGTSA
jgi:hypothetical protein